MELKARTLDSIHPKSDSIAKKLVTQKDTTHIYIDEYSMLHPKWFEMIYRQKHRYPNLKVYFFGDMKQASPVMDFNDPFEKIDYKTSALMHWLCDGNICELDYITGDNARFDEKTATELKRLDATGFVD